jgi:hypothetical protein
MSYLSEIATLIRAEVSPAIIPPDSDYLFVIYALLLLTKGSKVSEEDVHNAWCAWMSVKDPNHESLVPFDQLDQKTKDMDTPFVAAIRKVSASLS